MIEVRGVVRGGLIQIDNPLSLPEGTEVTVMINDDEFPETPEQIEEWLRGFHSFEPLEFTPEEIARLEAIRAEDKRIQLEVEEKRLRMIERLFP